MRSRRFPGSNITFTLPGGNEDNDLFAQVLEVEDGTMLLSCWEPNAAEREEIAAGARVNLFVWGNAHPPVAMTVGDVAA